MNYLNFGLRDNANADSQRPSRMRQCSSGPVPLLAHVTHWRFGMSKVDPYYTSTDPEDPVHHIYDDCPAGERVIADGNNIAGDNGYRLCDFCDSQSKTGHF